MSFTICLSCVGSYCFSSPSVSSPPVSPSSSASGCKGRQVHSVLYSSYVYLIKCVSGCLPVSFIFSLPLLSFSLISSALSALLLLLLRSSFSPTVRGSSTFPSPLFPQHLLVSSPAAHPSPSLFVIPLTSLLWLCLLRLTLPSSPNGLETLLSFIWICLRLEAHSKPQRKSRLCTEHVTLMRLLPRRAFTWTCKKQAVGCRITNLKCLSNRNPRVLASSKFQRQSDARIKQTEQTQ